MGPSSHWQQPEQEEGAQQQDWTGRVITKKGAAKVPLQMLQGPSLERKLGSSSSNKLVLLLGSSNKLVLLLGYS